MELHYVYYAIRKNGKPKVGATSNPRQRFRHYLSSKLLEVYTNPKIAGDREIELQLKYFGRKDNDKHYIDMINFNNNKNVKNKLSNTLKKLYSIGKLDISRLNTPSANNKKSIASKEMWKNPKRKEKMLRGTKHGRSTFTEDDVRFIRNHYYPIKNQHQTIPEGMYSTKQLMDKFNCSKGVILNIIKGKTYTSVK